MSLSDGHAGSRDARPAVGLERMEALCRGEATPAPLGVLLGLRLVEAGPGWTVVTMSPSPAHLNLARVVHGGVIGALCDTAMGGAVHSTLNSGETYTTAEFRVQFLRPVTVDTGPLRCTGEVVHRGRRIVAVEADVRDQDGALVARSSSTCLLTARSRPRTP